MEKFIVTTGKTIDLAVAAALTQLGLDRDSVSVEVLENAKSGFLGIGASPAKVKVTYEAPDEVVDTAPKSALSSASRSKPKERPETVHPSASIISRPGKKIERKEFHMKATGFVKKIDELGRIVIPKDIRRTLGVDHNDYLQFFLDGETIIMKKFGEYCAICNSSDDVVKFKDKFICEECLRELKSK